MLSKKKTKRNIFILLMAVMLFGAAPAGAEWVELAKLTASDAAAEDLFGYSVGISGTTAIVGTPYDDSRSGSAYLFDVSDPCNPVQIAKLTASDTSVEDEFGFSVAVSGTTALVGARLDGDWSGSVYLYDFSDPCNIIETKLTASDSAGGDLFGSSVAISGTTAVVGAPYDDSRSGSAYLFDVATGNQLLKLTASDAAADDFFGSAVAISGATAMVGAWRDDDAGNQSGSAYLFDVATGNQLLKLTASDAAADDRFGISVAIDGPSAIVGAYLDDHACPGDAACDSGSAYLFDVASGRQIAKLTASDSALQDNFGWSVAISGDTALVGARSDDHAAGGQSGSAYLYDFSDPCSITESKLTASDAAAFDWFGFRVALSGATAIVGAIRDDDACPGDPSCDSGSVYVLAKDSQCADPIELLLALAQDVISLNLQNGIENSLDAKLSAALGALQDVNENNNGAAINTLEAFINAVVAQSGDKIPNEGDANALIDSANEIIVGLENGCY